VTLVAWTLLVFAAVAAVGDWVAVVRHDDRLEYLCKPLTMALLIGVAATVHVDDPSVRRWFIVALVLSLLGDVFLMVPRDLFVAGLTAFLLAHIAYIIGLWTDGVSALPFALGCAAVAIAALVVGGRVLRSVRAGPQADLALPVGAYMVVISLMVASAAGTEEPLALGGAAVFFCSDALIAWDRFVTRRAWHGLAIMVTYHVAQAGLTLSLVT
jgi:uncharacterized membrane protein YhhN